MMRSLAVLALLALAACGQASAPTSTTAQTSTSTAPAAPTVAQLQAADFAAYPAPAFTGPRRLPNFYGAQSAFREYRTALGDGAEQGPNFAGQYALVQIGCGAGCNATYQIDLATGGIREVHFADETAVEIENHADSALLKARWFISPADPNGRWKCHFENYVWRGGQLSSLGQAIADGPCPD